MTITVKMIGPFIYAAGFSEKELEVPESSTIDDLLSLIKLDKSRPKIVTRNGRAVSSGDKIEAGDRIVISHIYSGG